MDSHFAIEYGGSCLQDCVSLMEVSCPNCHSEYLIRETHFYNKCLCCESVFPSQLISIDGSVTNQKNSISKDSFSFLTHEKVYQLKNSIKSSKKPLLIDIGAGDGEFIQAAKQAGIVDNESYGVEIDLGCIWQASLRGIQLKPKVDSINRDMVVTLWHSIEHFDPSEISTMIENIVQSSMSIGGRLTLLVCTPNSSSYLWSKFKENYCFYDLEKHHIQYSYRALWQKLADLNPDNIIFFAMYTYSLFGIFQTLANIKLRNRNLFYNKFKRGFGKESHTNILLKSIISFACSCYYLPFCIYKELRPKSRSSLNLKADFYFK